MSVLYNESTIFDPRSRQKHKHRKKESIGYCAPENLKRVTLRQIILYELLPSVAFFYWRRMSAIMMVLCTLYFLTTVAAFSLTSLAAFSSYRISGTHIHRSNVALKMVGAKKFHGGAGVGRLVLDEKAAEQNAVQCKYDMVLVERIQGRPKQSSGLFIPDEDLPKLHLCKVISMGPGREEENGTIQPMPNIKPGDVVIAKNPWGIGPKDEETVDGKKLSFMRAQDIAAVVNGVVLELEE